ncbi:hypothetical protein ACFE04_009508 [Oxalis oulophora]
MLTVILRSHNLCLIIFFLLLGRVFSTSNDDKNTILLHKYVHGAKIIVAADGSGQYRKIMDAVAKAPYNSPSPYAIHIKKGVYYEYVTINKPNILLVGDGMYDTVITGNRHFVSNSKTSLESIATVNVQAPKFMAINLTIENTYYGGHQALALNLNSDQSVLYQCQIKGSQDTLNAFAGRQFYKRCSILGTVDFIFGFAAAVFQDCDIQARNHIPTVVTAHGRNMAHGKTGFVLQFCKISRAYDYNWSVYSGTFLGRPWGYYSRSVIMQSFIDNNVNGKGWLPYMEWNEHPPKEPFFGEYKNWGPGSNLWWRNKWPGFHILNDKLAWKFTVNEFIDGDSWLPATHIPYKGGLY